MKVIISVTRETQYSSIVEMTNEQFDQFQSDLDGSDHKKRSVAEKKLNRLIDVKDWQDDSLTSLDEFEKLKD